MAVDVDGEEVEEGHTSAQFKNNRLVAYHFFLRSAQDWLSKMGRKGAWSGFKRPMWV
jgi:hypothetical protein